MITMTKMITMLTIKIDKRSLRKTTVNCGECGGCKCVQDAKMLWKDKKKARKEQNRCRISKPCLNRTDPNQTNGRSEAKLLAASVSGGKFKGTDLPFVHQLL